jgi:hypothetical protein
MELHARMIRAVKQSNHQSRNPLSLYYDLSCAQSRHEILKATHSVNFLGEVLARHFEIILNDRNVTSLCSCVEGYGSLLSSLTCGMLISFSISHECRCNISYFI